MSGFVGDLTPQQREVLEIVKERLLSTLEGKVRECADNALTNDAIVLRFLRARRFDEEEAFDMLYSMLKFRAEFQNIGVDALHPVMCENELRTGKSFFYKYDKEGRPIVYIRARLHDPSMCDPLENQRYCVLMMEYGKRLLRPPGETVTLVFDMNNASVRNIDIKSVLFMVQTLQSCYPESLGKVLIYKSTWLVNGAWKMVRPFMDPITASKVYFIKPEELTEHIREEDLPREYGGKDPFEYNYTIYKSNFSLSMEPTM